MIRNAKVIALHLGVYSKELLEWFLAIVISAGSKEISCKGFYYIIHPFEYVSRLGISYAMQF